MRRSTVRELAQGLELSPRVAAPPRQQPRACPQAAAYGMGLRSRQDCDLGLTLAHGGGYPGYGSYLLLLPEHGVGIFAFANRTYAGPSPPVWDAAVELHGPGCCRGRTLAGQRRAGRRLSRRRRDVRGRAACEPGRGRLAMNFLMDRRAENWARSSPRLQGARPAPAETDAPITPPARWPAASPGPASAARLQGQLLLAPTNPPTIQALRLERVVPRAMTWAATILTLYPEMFPGPLGHSLAGRALAEGIWSLETVQIRDFATDKHRSVDDTPAGGGAGMVMRADVLARGGRPCPRAPAGRAAAGDDAARRAARPGPGARARRRPRRFGALRAFRGD